MRCLQDNNMLEKCLHKGSREKFFRGAQFYEPKFLFTEKSCLLFPPIFVTLPKRVLQVPTSQWIPSQLSP